MKQRDDFLIEIFTEELPPKALLKIAHAFRLQMEERLQKADLTFTEVKCFATPRRIAVFVKDLTAEQPAQTVERKGPAKAAAFDASGQPSQACIGFARSCGVTPDQLITIQTPQGEWMGFKQHVPGKSVVVLMPAMIEQIIAQLPVPKRMRWGDNDAQFARPVLSVMMLFGDEVIDAVILGCRTNRVTYGHRFHAPAAITIPHAAAYESLLETEGYVIADFKKRREKIASESLTLVHDKLGTQANLAMNPDLLDEVTGLVEWPIPLFGNFDKRFLDVPKEVLISAMQDHQRYFPVEDAQKKLLPHFVTVSNIQSHDPARVIHGNERVLRARLSDAAFFFDVDKKEKLEQRLSRLQGIVYQAKLGTLHDKAERLSKLTAFIAAKINTDTQYAARAGLLAKTDLTTDMVGEFPELQGVMGYYYAQHDGEQHDVAVAMTEQYRPRFADDVLPKNPVGQALAMADRIDTLTGYFGINQIPTGDKDPYGLRRAALGVLRILIEEKINLDLKMVLDFAVNCYDGKLENPVTVEQVLNFMQERLRAYYQERGIQADVFAAVAALAITNPLDADKRIKAVQTFKKLAEAEALSIANKRVSNILSKYMDTLDAQTINPALFENEAEEMLAKQLDLQSKEIQRLGADSSYEAILLQLAKLRKPIDDFFDHVMVMTDDKSRRENRILLLKDLRALFLRVADIALLQ